MYCCAMSAPVQLAGDVQVTKLLCVLSPDQVFSDLGLVGLCHTL